MRSSSHRLTWKLSEWHHLRETIYTGVIGTNMCVSFCKAPLRSMIIALLPHFGTMIGSAKRQKTATEESLAKAQEEIEKAVQHLEKDVETVFRMIEQEDGSWLSDSTVALSDMSSNELDLRNVIQAAMDTATKEVQVAMEAQNNAVEPVLREHREALKKLLTNT
jgi:hypothetical protein